MPIVKTAELRVIEPAAPALELQTLERGTLQEGAYSQLRESLRSGRFTPGMTISIREAASALGTSPMPVRGALQRLEVEGALVANGPRRVLKIAELAPQELEELRDIRIELEGLAAARAAKLVSHAGIANIKTQLELMSRAASAGDVDAYVSANWAFHSAVYSASRMHRLVGMIETLWLRVGPYVRLMMPDKAHMMESIPHHEDLLRALQSRDARAARHAIRRDIEDAATTLLAYLESRQP